MRKSTSRSLTGLKLSILSLTIGSLFAPPCMAVTTSSNTNYELIHREIDTLDSRTIGLLTSREITKTFGNITINDIKIIGGYPNQNLEWDEETGFGSVSCPTTAPQGKYLSGIAATASGAIVADKITISNIDIAVDMHRPQLDPRELITWLIYGLNGSIDTTGDITIANVSDNNANVSEKASRTLAGIYYIVQERANSDIPVGQLKFHSGNILIDNLESEIVAGLDMTIGHLVPFDFNVGAITISNLNGTIDATGISIDQDGGQNLVFDDNVYISDLYITKTLPEPLQNEIDKIPPEELPNLLPYLESTFHAWGLNTSASTFEKGLIIKNIGRRDSINDNIIVGDSFTAAIVVEAIESPTQDGIVIKGDNTIKNVIEGDIKYCNGGKLNATFGNSQSYLKGGVLAFQPNDYSQADISMTFTNDSHWEVIKNSRLNRLTMNKGILQTTVNKAENGLSINQVTVSDEVAGDYNLVLNVNHVNGTLEGASTNIADHWILSQSNGSLQLNGVKLVENLGAAQPSAYDVVFIPEGQEINSDGAKKSNGQGKWYLVETKNPVNPPIEGGGESEKPPVDVPSNPGKPPVTEEVDQVLSLGSSITQALGMLSETEDLRMRMGDVRHGDTDGLWVRTYSRKDSAHGSFGNGFEQDVHGFHIGADHVIRTNNNASWLVGGAFHYGKSDIEGAAEAGGGDADIDQYTFKAYATYMKDNGAFADIVLHTGYYDTTLTGKDNTGLGNFKANYSNWGYGVSAEVGHRFDLSNIANSWYVEPTAQLTWFHAEGKNFRTSTGLEITQGDADFITGRLGAAVGKVFALGTANDPMSSYFSVAMKGGLLYQFDGDQTITAHGTDGATVVCTDAMDMKGARAYYGLTADWKIDDTWRVYGQISREEGSGYTKDYDASIGVRYAF